jgi:ATP-dependent Clp protease, protease subunit
MMKRWFTMKLADNDNNSGEIMIYDMIGKDPMTGDGMDATDFDAELKALGPVKNINLRINSPGGSVMDAVAIYTMLKSHPAKVTASIDGIAASGASLIAMAADKIVMPANTFMLIHKPHGVAIGTDEDMMTMASNLERMGEVFASTYAERSGQTAESTLTLMKQDRLMSADEAKSLGYADDCGAAIKMVAAYDMKLLPEKARAVMSAAVAADAPAAEVAEPVVEPAGIAEPVAEPAVVVQPKVVIAEPGQVVATMPIPAYGESEIHATLDLCTLAGKSKMSAAFIKAKTPIDKVREQLLAARASASDALDVDTVPAKTPEAHLGEWKMLQDKVKAEMGIGKR